MSVAEAEREPADRSLRLLDLISNNHSSRYLWTHRRLLWRVTRSELAARYAGSLLGISWAALAPALVLGIYAVVYMMIFRVRVVGLDSAGYVLFIFAGLVPYLACAEAISMGVSSVIANKSVLNNTVFPIDLAPVKAVFLAQTTMATGLVITVAGLMLSGRIHRTLVLLPLLWLLLVMSVTGINWIASLLNVVFRDLQNLVAALLMVTLVVSPIAYTAGMVPAGLRGLLIFNPFAYFVIAFQDVLVLGVAPSAEQWVALVSISLVLFGAGGWFFARTKPVLVDYV